MRRPSRLLPLRRRCPALFPHFPRPATRPPRFASFRRSSAPQPNDASSLTLLGLEYEQRARETGDPSYYSKADGVLNDALGLAPRSPLTESGLGSLALSRHLFGEGLRWGRRAIADGGARARAERHPVPLVRRRRRRAGRARPLRRGFRRVRPHGPARPGPRRLHARLLRPRAPRPPARRARADGRRRERGRNRAASRRRGLRVQLGKLYWGDGPDRRRPSGSTGSRSPPSPATSTRSTPWRWCGRRGDTSPPRSALERRAVDAHPAAAVRLDARRPLPQRRGTERPPRANTR